MDRKDVLESLQEYSDAVRGMGAAGLYLFGSAARDELGSNSDLDIFIDYDSGSHFSLIDLVAIKQFLEDELNVEVDLTTRDSLHPMLKADIEQSAIRVF
ncbi:nucleotidyltransferase domain-containing protein [Rhizobium sp. BE258]|uniref:nucleotidyltransferase family protein n=1 Tax=Rhizobium sp. BE258 TaxID=2817722 RepID=UPI00285F9FE7|nr:nucleotidyltransferase domain-containing protein [Rhizobium sp. BE258]MDR7144366.1 putative nucleotidyltransferase [Rhizobium sp. BE258]